MSDDQIRRLAEAISKNPLNQPKPFVFYPWPLRRVGFLTAHYAHSVVGVSA